jgi:hypothetical protein
MGAQAFEGIPRHLQILHIEQEVNGTDVSVLQTVLNCDVERETLLAEERALLAAPGTHARTHARTHACMHTNKQHGPVLLTGAAVSWWVWRRGCVRLGPADVCVPSSGRD